MMSFAPISVSRTTLLHVVGELQIGAVYTFARLFQFVFKYFTYALRCSQYALQTIYSKIAAGINVPVCVFDRLTYEIPLWH
jgi:hypothetical protein